MFSTDPTTTEPEIVAKRNHFQYLLYFSELAMIQIPQKVRHDVSWKASTACHRVLFRMEGTTNYIPQKIRASKKQKGQEYCRCYRCCRNCMPFRRYIYENGGLLQPQKTRDGLFASHTEDYNERDVVFRAGNNNNNNNKSNTSLRLTTKNHMKGVVESFVDEALPYRNTLCFNEAV